GLLTEVVLRYKSNQLNWLWPKFFRFYPPSKPLGLLMSFLLAGNLTYLLIISFTTAVQRIRLNTPAFLFAVFSLSALTILAVSVLSLAEDYENATRERLRAERLKTELITNVSHDIRTPLTAIISYVDLLKQTNCSEEEYQGYVEVLARKAARLKTLLEDLMDASKAGSGNVTVTLQEIDLAEIVSQVASEFDDAYDERNLTLVLRLPEHPLPVMTDSRHLYRTLENLFSNAGRYSLPGTRVFAEIAAEEGYLVFTLKNTSMVPLDVPTSALTEQFIRGDRSRHSEGSGLGLYIAKSLIELMGGAFEIQVTGDLFSVEIRLLELHL
ncbi:MAG: HAMP domain-containing histidine kinase, partial [Symbiobacteriaceae bacterium]|nr:HAMP domain-containing histidine kinase [Symbiobacteriaceae bacterium]